MNLVHSFDTLLLAMSIAAVVVFIALQFVEAGYGMMFSRKWGISVDNRLGWVLMESPVFFAMLALWWMSERTFMAAPLAMFVIFQLHYVQRAFIFPLLIRGHNRMPVSIMLMGVVFNLLNAVMQGGWLFYRSPADRYPDSWLLSPQFISGTIVFFAGMFINQQSDYVMRHLRKPGDTAH